MALCAFFIQPLPPHKLAVLLTRSPSPRVTNQRPTFPTTRACDWVARPSFCVCAVENYYTTIQSFCHWYKLGHWVAFPSPLSSSIWSSWKVCSSDPPARHKGRVIINESMSLPHSQRNYLCRVFIRTFHRYTELVRMYGFKNLSLRSKSYKL